MGKKSEKNTKGVVRGEAQNMETAQSPTPLVAGSQQGLFHSEGRMGKEYFEEKLAAMREERRKQDAKIYQKYGWKHETVVPSQVAQRFDPATVTKEDIEKRLADMMETRRQLDAEIHKKYGW